MEENYSEWISIYFDAANIVSVYWTIYVAVVAIVLGCIFQRGLHSARERVFIAAGFFLFTSSNIQPLYLYQRTMHEAAKVLSGSPYSEAEFIHFPATLNVAGHLLFDVIVFGLIWKWKHKTVDGASV